VGRFTLLLILALIGPAHAETRPARVDLSGERAREEVPRSHVPGALRPIDLSRFATPPSRMFAPIVVPEPAKLEAFELRDNAARDWAADRDFELAAMWDALSIAVNHHVIDRNWDDAQVTATLTREF
jgi:hypothetical protein